jgi:coproporphyrinogen III oxidase-like Fe-S oxidoreductase
LDVAAYEKQWGSSLSHERITALTQNGLIACDNGRVCTTSRGRLLLNAVVAELAS